MIKKALTISLVICLLTTTLFSISSCKKKESEDPISKNLKREMQLEDNDFEDPAFDNEVEGAEIGFVPHKEKDFIGVWTAPSDRAEYLFGNVSLNINSDYTWSGIITDESFHGKWSAVDGSCIVIKDTENLINWRLFYADDGTLMFNEVKDPEISIVLKPGSKKF